jgi:hypothetical protein
MEIGIPIIIVSIFWYLYHQYHINKTSKKVDSLTHEINNLTINREYEINKRVNENMEEFTSQILILKKQLIEVEMESYKKGKKQAEENFANDFSIQVFPFKRLFKEKKDGLLAFGEVDKVEIGYQYQLFIKGAPAFKPEMVVLEVQELKHFKLNEESIGTLVNIAIGDKTEIAGGIIKVAKSVLLKK